MPRNRLGQFTARRRTVRTGLFAGREPITGTEENGVVSGETVVLGAELPPEIPIARETARAKA